MYLPPKEMQIFEILDEMRCFGGKRWEKVVNCMKMVILNESEPHYVEKAAK